MKAALERIMKNWVQATQEQFTHHDLATFFRKDFQGEVTSIVNAVAPNFQVKASAGAGNWASVPWVSILDPKVTQTTQSGIYPVYLFCADGSGVYLSLGFGTTDLKNNYGTAEAKKVATKLSSDIRAKDSRLLEWSDDIKLNSSTNLGRSYEWASAGARYYPLSSVPSDELLLEDLKTLLDIYAKVGDSSVQKEDGDIIVNCGQALPKPFLLLAGISGTGKSRFVREQATEKRNPAAKQKIISVRPDWHEPSDLLGYVSRLRNDGDEYIVTDALRFIFSAWQAVRGDGVAFVKNGVSGSRSDLNSIPPFWLGLDEMNLAPVEQYFADYLSVIESRKWEWDGDDFTYTCEPLLSAEHCQLIKDEKLRDSINDELWVSFEQYGMPVPFNLIVAGTVNMDETTHGFSRKVIDRALTIDFGEFSPNTFDDYFEEKVEPRVFSYPTLSVVKQNDFVGTADKHGKKSIDFLKAINGVLKDTPFELAYRALNELLISVVCEKPADEAELKAVWDDFLMTKVLPRIEGDADKLWEVTKDGKTQSILVGLQNVVQEEFGDAKRKDLFLQSQKAENTKEIDYRSPKKIKMMAKRLESAGFTSFWP